MKKDNVVILKKNNESIGKDAYKAIARALINVYGTDVCKVLVKEGVNNKDKCNGCIARN